MSPKPDIGVKVCWCLICLVFSRRFASCSLDLFGYFVFFDVHKQQNEQKLRTGVDKALPCLEDLLGPMSTLGDIGSYKYKCHFEMNLETAGNDKNKAPAIHMDD